RAHTTSIFLDAPLEALVGDVTAVLHNEINVLLKRAAAGEALSDADKTLVPHFSALKTLTGDQYDELMIELAREAVYQLKDSVKGTVKRVASKVNSMQGAVAQSGFFR